MTHLYFATGNLHKIEEVNALLPVGWQVLPISELGITEELPETGDTLEHNAQQKALYVANSHQVSCFAEDTGLEIDALNGRPGVFSARYAGPGRDSAANMNKVLQELQGETNRTARFRTVIALVMDGQIRLFSGSVEGRIADTPAGSGGFGYDPIFIPEGYQHTFAELPVTVKHRISHRARAVRELIDYLAALD
jgi:XTP/dITP diphosphohydrolase